MTNFNVFFCHMLMWHSPRGTRLNITNHEGVLCVCVVGDGDRDGRGVFFCGGHEASLIKAQ